MEVAKIINEIEANLTKEYDFFFDMQKASKANVKLFEALSLNENEFNKTIVTALIGYEHQLMEIYAGRILSDYNLLDSLKDILEKTKC